MLASTMEETATPGTKRMEACTRSFSTEMMVACRYSSSLCAKPPAPSDRRTAAAATNLVFISPRAPGRSHPLPATEEQRQRQQTSCSFRREPPAVVIRGIAVHRMDVHG